MNKFFLIDGHSQIFRMYYAFLKHPLINSKGIDTSILFGFTKMVLELIQKENPTHLAVVFDSHAKTFRHSIFKDYKANRPPAPELIIESMEPLKKILTALNIPFLMQDGVEADDIIGSIAKQWGNSENKIYMVTPDKDYGQLINENIFQYKLPKGGNGSVEIIGEKEICVQYGISDPKSVIDILSIWGDTSDNIPGVKGIGEVGAKKLISEYSNIENLIEHIDELPTKQGANIKNSIEQLKLSKFLVTIKTDVELEITPEQTRVKQPNMQMVNELFSLYEFNSLKKLITSSNNPADLPNTKIEIEQIEDFPEDERDKEIKIIPPTIEKEESKKVVELALKYKEIYLNLLETSNCIVIGSKKENNCFIYTLLGREESISELVADIFKNQEIRKVGYGLKRIYKFIKTEYNIELNGEFYDLQILHYLLNPEISHSIDFILREQINTNLEELINNGDREKIEQPLDLFSATSEDNEVVIVNAAITCSVYSAIKEKLIASLGGVIKVYQDIEMPLIKVLADMEIAGVKIDFQQLATYSKELTQQMKEIEEKARDIAGEPSLNLASPKQVGVLLYEKLKVDPKVKKSSKGNYPTDEATLNNIRTNHPIIKDILEYRNLKKLLSTYIDALPELINKKSGKVHTNFNQALTATGRLSSNNPNLQNIPIRTERGREIRKAFIPSNPDGYIVSADYSQIELRIMAHLSGDRGLIEDFNSGKDIHSATASKLFGIDLDRVTNEQRRKAKTVNFGIIYGISSYGLSERMEIGVKEAKEFIETYFKTYPGVAKYISDIVENGRKKGYVETIYGRRRYLKDINSRNVNVRKFNERNAVNAPLQGSAADIIKIAMINIAKRLDKEGLKSKMVVQVHDELVFDVVKEELEKVMQIAQEEMNNVVKLNVPLIADCGYGKNWLQAH